MASAPSPLEIPIVARLPPRHRPPMESLLHRSLRVVRSHPAPALSFSRLRVLVRATGVAVSEEVLLQALRSGREHVRVIDPWIGPWSLLVESRGALSGRRSRALRGDETLRGALAEAPLPGGLDIGELWAVGHPDELVPPAREHLSGSDRPGEPRAWLRIRREVAVFGWCLDRRSAKECTTWLAMVLEFERLRALARTEAVISAAPRRSDARGEPSTTRRPGPERRTSTPAARTVRRRGATPPSASR